MVSSCENIADNYPQSNKILGMSSYLPMRPSVPTRGDDMHTTDNSSYVDHFLNIPEICPSSTDYRSPRYYMGSYQAEACRMEALQQQQRSHDLRMGLQGSRSSFYPHMSVPSNLRFRENDALASNINTNNKAEPISPCSTGTPVAVTSEGETPPSFYPWMSIVG